MMVIVAVVRMPNDVSVLDCSKATRVVEVMVAERKGKVQRERCEPKQRCKP